MDALEKSHQLVLRNAGQLDQAYKYTFGNCEFLISVSDHGKVIYIQTVDPDFKTPEGVTIKSSQSDITKLVGDQRPKIERGWAKYYVLNSGWNVAFSESATEDSIALYIFKR